MPYLHKYIHAGVAIETFACAPDTSESTYEIGHVAVEDMHLPYSRKIWRELNLTKSPQMANIKYW